MKGIHFEISKGDEMEEAVHSLSSHFQNITTVKKDSKKENKKRDKK